MKNIYSLCVKNIVMILKYFSDCIDENAPAFNMDPTYDVTSEPGGTIDWTMY